MKCAMLLKIGSHGLQIRDNGGIMEVLHNDTYSDKLSQIESMIVGRESLAMRYLRIDLYIEQGRYEDAQDLLDNLPYDKVLDFRKDEEYADYQMCYDVLISMRQSGMSELSMLQELALEEIVAKRSTQAAGMAAYLLHVYADRTYQEVLVAPSYLEGRSSSSIRFENIPERPSQMKLSPNPAADFLIVELKDAIAIEQLEIIDTRGVVHKVEQNVKSRSAVVIGLKGLKSGSYVLRAISISGEEIESKKFIISQ